MSAPKKGDRVKVTYQAEVLADQPDGVPLLIGVPGKWGHFIPSSATVEVLASPVYVNHDTTEYRVGDVVRDADACVVVRLPGASWIDTEDGGRVRDTYLTPPLTLLIRDGQVIA